MHQPVLLTETIEALNIQPNHWYIDGTFGRGGHSAAIIQKGGKVIAFDFDPQAIEFGQNQFAQEITDKKLILIKSNFDKLGQAVDKPISGVLFDFGTSSDQLTDKERGFSFDSDTHLDMRMDPSLGVTAKDLLAIVPEKQLAELFQDYGGESEAKAIAHAIEQRRKSNQPITTTRQLADLVSKAKKKKTSLHPATKVFQALRIAVNDELNNIKRVLPQALEILSPHGRIVTISFHDGEDRIAKHTFKEWQQQNLGTIITKKPITPTQQEINDNQKSRSAKLRIFEKS